MTKPTSCRSARRLAVLVAGAVAAAASLAGMSRPADAQTSIGQSAARACIPHVRATADVSPLGMPLVTLNINGGQVHLLLDTGAERTTLTERAVHRLGLVTVYRPGQNMQGVGGNVAAGAVRPGRVSAGGMLLASDTTFAVIPVALPPVGTEEVEGLLGADLLRAFDIDLDIGHHLITFYDPVTCANPRLGWPRPYSSVPAWMSAHGHLVFMVFLNNQVVNAFIDTGAQISTLDAGASARIGVGPALLQGDPTQKMRGVSGEEVIAYDHRFDRMIIPPAIVPTPDVMVTPLHLDDADLLFGADFLAAQRIWLSYSTNHIYVELPE